MSNGGKKPGAGRPKGSVNKLTGDLRKAIHEAYEKAGGVDYLLQVAHDDPKTFCGLLAKTMPKEIVAEVNHTMKNLMDEINDGGS